MADVAELLARSRSHHADYRRIVGTRALAREVRQSQARDALTLALDAREQAHQADPEHVDPAWALDRAPHGELVAFYRQTIGAEADA